MTPRNVEVVNDFMSKRAGIIKALSKDVELFFELCDPTHPNLCLYGLPSRQWEVKSPSPFSELPEPKLGINLVRDAMTKTEWLSVVALHSESWLHAVASYFCSKYKFDKVDRKRVFIKMSEMPLISELVMDVTARERVNASLPEEMVVRVLLRLPVKDLLRYRGVCKKWRSLIDDPDFRSEHLEKYESKDLVVIIAGRGGVKSKDAWLRRSDSFQKVGILKMMDDMTDCRVLGHINGLVLVRESHHWSMEHIRLWNPSMNTFVELPDTVFKSQRRQDYFALGLGYDASINDYKVLAIRYSYCISLSSEESYAIHPKSVRIYTLRSNSWTAKRDVCPPSEWMSRPQVFAQGAIHWLGVRQNNPSWLIKKDPENIVSFDVTKEVFYYMEMPVDDDIWQPKEKVLAVMDGRLAMFYAHISHNDVWIMKEYGIPKSWTNCYTFALEQDKLLYFKGNGVLFFSMVGSGIKSYDIKRKHVKHLTDTYYESLNYTVFTHLESLLSIKTTP